MNTGQTSHPTPDQLAAFGLGKLGPEESAAIEDHIAHCDSCCQFLKEVADDTLVELLREKDTDSGLLAAGALDDAGRATADAASFSNGSADSPADALEVDSQVTGDLGTGETVSSPAAIEVPEELADHPRYEVERLLGRGGMGDVYQARHRLMERTVAIKVINPEIVNRPEAVRRFQREVKAAASLSHPNIVTAYDAEQAGDLHLLVMEYVDGRDLGRVVKDSGSLSVEDACRCVRQAALGLEHARACDMVHRDIKPQNLMLTPEGEVKILDFGLAQFAREAAASGRPGGDAGELTDARSMMGTPDYMAPEQAESAHTADIRSDIYSLGATLYYLLAAAPPFPEGSVVEKLRAHAETEAPPLAEVRADVPAELEEILRRMMAKDPAERYQTPAEVAEALAPLAGVGPRRRRPLAWVAAAGLAAVVVFALSIVITLRTSYGTVTVEIAEADAEDVEVTFKRGEEVHVASAKQGWQIRLKEGKWQLELTDASGKFQLDTDTVTIIRNGRETVRVTLKPKPKPFERTGKPLLATLHGHEAEVLAMAYSARKKLLASGSADGTVRLWEAETGELLATLRGHIPWVWAVAFSPDGNTLASAAEGGGEIWFWDVGRRRLKSVFKDNQDSLASGWWGNLFFCPGGNRLVVSENKKWEGSLINVWDVKTGALVTSFQLRSGRVCRCALSPDGATLAYCAGDGFLTLWDIESGRELWSRRGDPKVHISVAFSPDGKTLAAGHSDRSVRLWDVAAGRVLAQLPGYHSGGLSQCLAFSRDGKILASGRRLILLWHVEVRRQLGTLEGHGHSVTSLVFYADGRTLASAGKPAEIRVWDIQDVAAQAALPTGTIVRKPRATLRVHEDEVHTIAYSPTGTLLASAGFDGTIRLWEAETGELLATLRGHTGTVCGVAFSPDGSTLVSAGQQDGKILLWDVATRRLRSSFKENQTGYHRGLAFSPDGKRLVVPRENKVVNLWELKTGALVRSFEGHAARFEEIALAPDGTMLACGGEGGWLTLWDVESGRKVWTRKGDPRRVCSVAFSPDGKTLATGNADQYVRLWDVAAGRVLAQLPYSHSGWVWAVAFSPDGKILASGVRDIRLWHVQSRRLVATLSGHSEEVRALVFSPDGRTLASASRDHSIKLWDVVRGEEEVAFDGFDGKLGQTAKLWDEATSTLRGHTRDVRWVAFSPNGKTLATASSDRTAILWDLPAGQQRATLEGHSAGVNSVDFTRDGKMLATAGVEGTIKLWDLTTRKQLSSVKGHAGMVLSVEFAPDGKTLASASEDGTAKVWEVATGAELATLGGHTAIVQCASFAPDGKTLATGSCDRSVKLWDAATWNEQATLQGHTNNVNCVAFSPDGKTLASGSRDKTIRLWDVAKRKEQLVLRGHTDEIRSLAFTPDGRTLVSGSQDLTIKLWDSTTGRIVATLSGHAASVWNVACSPDGRTLASASKDRTVKLWDVSQWTGRPVLMATLKGHTADVRSVAFSPNGETLATGSYDSTAKLWDLPSGKERVTFKGHMMAATRFHRGVTRAVFAPDGETLATAGMDFTVRLWEVATGKELSVLTGHTKGVFDLHFSPDGKTLASASHDRTVKVWDVATASSLATLRGHTNAVECVAFAPDGRTLASGSTGTVKLWDAATWKERATLKGHGGQVWAVAFSPDGNTLATSGWDRSIRLWDPATGKVRRVLLGHTHAVPTVAFSPDGKTLASGSSDWTVKLWDVGTGRTLATVLGQPKWVWSVAFSPDGRTLATGSVDKTVKLWDVSKWTSPPPVEKAEPDGQERKEGRETK